MNLFHPQEWNFTSEHPSKRTLATADELRIYEKLYRGCLHSAWTRLQNPDGRRHATCNTCGISVDLEHGGTEFERAEPVLPDRAVRELFLRRIPHTRYDDVNANRVLRDLEAAGWYCIVHKQGNLCACSMSKGYERFASAAHPTRAAAITEAAGLVLRGLWPR